MSGKTLIMVDGRGVRHMKACYVKEETEDGFIRQNGVLKFNTYYAGRHVDWQTLVRQKLEHLYPAYHFRQDKLTIIQKNAVYLIPREKFNCTAVEMMAAEASKYLHWNILVESPFLTAQSFI